MRIVILSQNSKIHSTSRLLEAAKARDHQVDVVDYRRCYMNITSAKPHVMYKGAALKGVDAIIPRIGASWTFYGTSVVRQFEVGGTYTPNTSQSIARSRDKLRSLQILASEGIGLPTTGFSHSTKNIGDLIDMVGGAPLVVKLLEGTQGIGVVLCETKKAAESVMEAFRGLEANILVQEFIKESGGADVRAFVVGKKVVAAMIRQGGEGEFRSNLHRGGSAEATKLSADERATAVLAAHAMGLRVAGVDMLRSNRGPLIMEVNSSPGLEGIEAATGVDVASKVIEYIEKHARPTTKQQRRQA